jgi:hypothetical protein
MTTARIWNGNSGIPEPPPEEEVELDEVVYADVTEELAGVLEVADDDVEVLVVVEVRAESGTTEIEELPLLATKSSPFWVS